MLNKLSLLLASLMFFTANASAAIMTFSDRTAFEAALFEFIIDDLNDVQDGYLDAGLDRGAYSFNMISFGCNSGPGQCGDNSSKGFNYPAYIWTYSNGSFTFDAPIYAFGLDYGYYYDQSSSLILNGFSVPVANSGFFGFISSTAFNTVSYIADSGSLFDNITYSYTGTDSMPVPLPGTFGLLALGLIGMVYRRRNYVSH